MRDKRFRKSNHLLKSSEFRKVFGQGHKIITHTLVFHVLFNDLNECRLGLAVSRKVGKAVFRNHVKRRIREAFRENKEDIPGAYDIVVYPRKGVLEKHFRDYLSSFEYLVLKLRARYPKKRSEESQ